MLTFRQTIGHRPMACVVLFGVIGSLNSGCALMTHGTEQPISLRSTPIGAHIYLDGQLLVDKTPAVVKVSRGSDHSIELRMEGYLPQSVPLTRQFSTATLGNVWCGGLIGMIVDAMSGANYKFDPGYYDAVLRETSVAVAEPKPVCQEYAELPSMPASGPYDHSLASGAPAIMPSLPDVD